MAVTTASQRANVTGDPVSQEPVHRLDPSAVPVDNDEGHQPSISRNDGADLRHIPSSLHQLAAKERLEVRRRHPPNPTIVQSTENIAQWIMVAERSGRVS